MVSAIVESGKFPFIVIRHIYPCEELTEVHVTLFSQKRMIVFFSGVLCCHPSILDVRLVDAPAGVTQEEGHTGFLHLSSVASML